MADDLSESTLNELFSAALIYQQLGADNLLAAIREELNRRDAQRTVWPSGDEAAQQLAEAAYAEMYSNAFDIELIVEENGIPISYDMLTDTERAELTYRFAAVLARLAGAEGDDGQ